MLAVLKLSCEDTSDYEMDVFVVSIIFILIPFNLIIASTFKSSHCSQNEISLRGGTSLAMFPSHLTVVSLYLARHSGAKHDTWLPTPQH